jgi:hypothetical protein
LTTARIAEATTIINGTGVVLSIKSHRDAQLNVAGRSLTLAIDQSVPVDWARSTSDGTSWELGISSSLETHIVAVVPKDSIDLEDFFPLSPVAITTQIRAFLELFQFRKRPVV